MKKLKLLSFLPSTYGTIPGKNSPTIRFSKSRNNISLAACKLMNLKAKSSVSFHQDQESPGIWYLRMEPTGIGFTLESLKGSAALHFYNSNIAGTILECFVEEKSVIFQVHGSPIKQDGVEYWKLTIVDTNNEPDEVPEPDAVVLPTKRRGRPPGSSKNTKNKSVK